MRLFHPNLSPRSAGFTLIELVVVLMLVGILGAIAAPRFFDRSVFNNRGFEDQVLVSLRYAQKAAIAQHRFVCVTFNLNGLTLTTGATSACGNSLASPDGQSSYVVNSAAVFSSTPGMFSFDALGRPSFATTLQINISGFATPICVARETGYVYVRPSGWAVC